jgi:Flp pilus assembly protein TadG
MRGRRGQGGAVAVEFALILPIFLWLVFGVIQYGYYFYAMQAGTAAAGEAVRRVTVGDCQVDSDLTTFVTNHLGKARTSGTPSVSRTYQKLNTSTNAWVTDVTPGTVGGNVTIQVQFNTLNMHFPFIPVPDNGTVTRVFTGRMEDTVGSGKPCT